MSSRGIRFHRTSAGRVVLVNDVYDQDVDEWEDEFSAPADTCDERYFDAECVQCGAALWVCSHKDHLCRRCSELDPWWNG